MEYLLQQTNRNSSDEDIIQDIIRVSTALGKSKLTKDEYKLHGKYGCTTVERHFGTWNKALVMGGLEVTQKGISKHKRCSSVDDFCCDLRKLAKTLGVETVTSGEYRKYGTYDCSQMFRYYHSWDRILKEAGLTSTMYRIGTGKQISDIELLQEIQRVWNLLNRQPKVSDFDDGIFRFSRNTFSRRFGGWQKSLEAFVKWIEDDFLEKKDDDIVVVEAKEAPYSIRGTRNISLALKLKVMDRDGYMCVKCGANRQTDPEVKFHIDHIISWVDGGATELDNLQLLCSTCNLKKGSKSD